MDSKEIKMTVGMIEGITVERKPFITNYVPENLWNKVCEQQQRYNRLLNMNRGSASPFSKGEWKVTMLDHPIWNMDAIDVTTGEPLSNWSVAESEQAIGRQIRELLKAPRIVPPKPEIGWRIHSPEEIARKMTAMEIDLDLVFDPAEIHRFFKNNKDKTVEIDSLHDSLKNLSVEELQAAYDNGDLLPGMGLLSGLEEGLECPHAVGEDGRDGQQFEKLGLACPNAIGEKGPEGIGIQLSAPHPVEWSNREEKQIYPPYAEVWEDFGRPARQGEVQLTGRLHDGIGVIDSFPDWIPSKSRIKPAPPRKEKSKRDDVIRTKRKARKIARKKQRK